jgi:hypothetical protein
MHSELNRQQPDQKNRRRGPLNASGFLLIALAVGVVLLFFTLPEDDSIDEDPALDALLRAQSHLVQSYRPEQDLLSESQAAHRELSAAIELLAAAQQEDPATAEKIKGLRSELQAIESEKDFGGMTPENLQARYRKLRRELEALIDERLKRHY